MDEDDMLKEIIDVLLTSPLNIEYIPDELERQIYEVILHRVNKSLLKKLCCCLK